MPNAIFEDEANEEMDVTIHRRDREGEKTKSKSELAQWLAQHEFVPNPKVGEMRVILISILIISVAIAIFVYGKGKREATTLEQTGNVYLESQR